MRILYYHSGSDLYGASRSLLRLTKRLVDDGHRVNVVLPSEGPLCSALQDAGVAVQVARIFPLIERRALCNPLRGVVFLLSLPVALLQTCLWIWRFRPDIVHSNTSVIPVPALATRLLRVPHVWHLRETYVGFAVFWRWYRRYLCWGSDRVVAVSSPIAEQLSAAAEVRVIHNGLPLSEVQPVPRERTEAFRARYGLGDARLVGLVGRIKYVRKGQEFFVDAVAALKSRFSDVRFLLVGSPFPGNEQHLERLRERMLDCDVADVMVYTGDIEDIKAVYAALDVSVLASALPEPFGGVVIESMAFGVPVVGTAIGGTLEQVVDGETGWLVPPGDAGALARAIASILEDDDRRDHMARAARKRFEMHFEFERFYAAITALYQEVAD